MKAIVINIVKKFLTITQHPNNMKFTKKYAFFSGYQLGEPKLWGFEDFL